MKEGLARIEAALPTTMGLVTKNAYLMMFRFFATWCEEHKLCALPCSPKVLSTYISYLARRNYKRTTMRARFSAISQAHLHLGYEAPSQTPEFKRIWKGIRRSKPSDRVSRAALTIDLLRQ